MTAIGRPVTTILSRSASSSSDRGSTPSFPGIRNAVNVSSHHATGSGTARYSTAMTAPVASAAASSTKPWDDVPRSSAHSASAGSPVTTTNTTAGVIVPASAHIAIAKTAADPASTETPSPIPYRSVASPMTAPPTKLNGGISNDSADTPIAW